MQNCSNFLRIVAAVQEAARKLGFDADVMSAIGKNKTGTFQQQADKNLLYLEIPRELTRDFKDTVWDLCGAVIMKSTPTATPPPRQAEPAAATTSSRDRPAAIDRHHAAAVRRVRKQQRSRSRC